MLRTIRRGALHLLKSAGLFELTKNSAWRGQRLLILCYHGIALDEEHKWMPDLYMHPELFEQRLKALKAGKYAVLPLGDAIARLYRNDLPPKSVAITFDDGTYDFYAKAYPLLKAHGFPATVYQTTYYCDSHQPIFHLICSYMLWKRRGLFVKAMPSPGIPEILDLRASAGCAHALKQLVTFAEQENLSEQHKNQLAEKLASALDLDYPVMVRKGVLQLMHREEIAQLASEGIDFQLHTHRHRTPLDERLFVREIRDNRAKLLELAAVTMTSHFCYPSGVYHLEFLPWLEKEGVISATTCEAGLASIDDNPLLLPRYVDTAGRTPVEFESWLSGVAAFAFRSRRRHKGPSSGKREIYSSESMQPRR